MFRSICKLSGSVALLGLVSLFPMHASASLFDAGIPAGWTCVGSCGTSGADGDVTLAPGGGSQYGWVSTSQGVTGVGLGLGSETSGSVLTSTAFGAQAGDELEFLFNYVTSDGAGFSDYAWARLLDDTMNEVAFLFGARTTPAGDTVPGDGLPLPDATLDPTGAPIIPGGPAWSPLGGSSGSCYAAGCGYTDWVNATYTVATSGNYILEFGVVNWIDFAFQSGLAIDGFLVAGDDPFQPPVGVPVPATLGLMGIGLLALGVGLRRRRLV
ncbi:hypothetical protein B1C78_16020 [Thioalkalivibrio denitrificans]|uniref:Ice-binding protein C-terminal domain-containing protein n=1 Tax=Thioalkalivibrio denitrificans TaxID=108003 RepID=A0A1V3NAF3_9GAMM|nr:NF038132 family protein [Thioalkalivibrio denitrificans]OOG21786.1 hypothetical protein B1C78_16020 [Thioalkalivibrio denitrificans]